MDFWPEFLASNWGKEFVAGGAGGIAGVLAGHPFDTVRIRQQHSGKGSAYEILRRVAAKEGPCALFKGMLAPLSSVTFQNAIVFQSYAILSRSFDNRIVINDPPSYNRVILAGIGAGAIQSLVISPVEQVKIRLQLQKNTNNQSTSNRGPIQLTQSIFRAEGWRGIYRGLNITVLRDAPSHGVYFWTYEYLREQLHPGCRKNGDESFATMLVAGGTAGVTSWICCYPLDVVKTKIQAQAIAPPLEYSGIVDCFRKTVRREGYNVLWRGFGITVGRAFIVNGAVFAAYELALRCIYNHSDHVAVEEEELGGGKDSQI